MAPDFDQITRSLAMTPSRRGLAGLLTAGVLAAVGWDASARRKRKKKRKKKCKPACAECQFCRKRTCLAVENGTPCDSADVCENGQCVALGCGSGPACITPEVCREGQCVTLRCGNGGPCRVFNSFELLVGAELGPLAKADETCQSVADDAGLNGTFLAWLSDGLTSPANRFTNRDQAGPYQLPPNDTDGNNPRRPWRLTSPR